MKTKVIGAAVAATLLGLSTASFGQAAGGTAGASGASGQDTPTQAGRADAAPGASGTSGAVTSGSGAVTSGTATTGTATSRCDSLTGSAKTRCQRDERASTGSSTTAVPATQNPGDSGPGAVDKTRPGQEPVGRDRANPRDTGTSSAGSN
jgi:hypothetical protein